MLAYKAINVIYLDLLEIFSCLGHKRLCNQSIEWCLKFYTLRRRSRYHLVFKSQTTNLFTFVSIHSYFSISADTMATLLQLIATFPVLEAILSALSYADLLNLSRVSTSYRAILHGFNCPTHLPSHNGPDVEAPIFKEKFLKEDPRKPKELQRIRLDLHIGNHQTDTWRRYKSVVRWLCSEPHHTVGQRPKQCLRCSMPVCETCIVKSSMKKNQHTYDRRRRLICEDCWARGVPHHEGRRVGPHEVVFVDYERSKLCHCMSSDGILCLGCIEQQNSDLDRKLAYCAGNNCSNKVIEDSAGGRVCLWCTGVLPSLRSKDERKKVYDARYLSLTRKSKSQEIAEQMNAARGGRTQLLGFEDQRWASKKFTFPSSLSIPSSSSSAPSSSCTTSTETEHNDLRGLREPNNDGVLGHRPPSQVDTTSQRPIVAPRPPLYPENMDSTNGTNMLSGYSDDEETLVAQEDGDLLETITLGPEENPEEAKITP